MNIINLEKYNVGFTVLENELLQTLYSYDDMTASEMRILIFIIYQTIGYHRTYHSLTINFIANGTGIPYWTAQRALRNLISKGILNVSCNKNRSRHYSINNHYNQWVGNNDNLSNYTSRKCQEGLGNSDKIPLAEMTTKTNKNKTNKNKTNKGDFQKSREKYSGWQRASYDLEEYENYSMFD